MLKTVFENKKDLVKAVSEFAGENAKYMGASDICIQGWSLHN